MDFRLLIEVDDGAEEVEESLVGLVALEHVDEFVRAQLLVVLRRDLHDHLQVLADVLSEHRLQTLQRVVHRQRAEVVHQPLQNE